jgi:LysR family glycine cleavage system transcriptional activator
VPNLSEIQRLSFREELHAIDAAIAEQGIVLVSNLLVARELEQGILVKAVEITLPGFGFYMVHESNHPRQSMVDLFISWAVSMATRGSTSSIA